MKKNAGFMVLVVGLVALFLVGAVMMGCVSTADIDARAEAKLSQWQTEHPTEAVTPEIKKQIWSEAKAELEKEAAARRAAAAAGGAAAAGKFATGDIFGGIASLVGVIGLIFGGKKTEEAKT